MGLWTNTSISDKVTFNLNVFGPFMKHWILGNIDGKQIITMHRHWSSYLKPSSISKFFNHTISHVAWAIALYSTSALERDTTSYFLLLQVTRFLSTKVQYPVVDFLFPRSSAYPESEYLDMCTCSCFLCTNSFLGQLLI